MNIQQHPYLSPEAMALRARDGTPTWGVHVCEVESLGKPKQDRGVFDAALRTAADMRRQLEAGER